MLSHWYIFKWSIISKKCSTIASIISRHFSPRYRAPQSILGSKVYLYFIFQWLAKSSSFIRKSSSSLTNISIKYSDRCTVVFCRGLPTMSTRSPNKISLIKTRFLNDAFASNSKNATAYHIRKSIHVGFFRLFRLLFQYEYKIWFYKGTNKPLIFLLMTRMSLCLLFLPGRTGCHCPFTRKKMKSKCDFFGCKLEGRHAGMHICPITNIKT
jgi:hypothetical protein